MATKHLEAAWQELQTILPPAKNPAVVALARSMFFIGASALYDTIVTGGFDKTDEQNLQILQDVTGEVETFKAAVTELGVVGASQP